MKEQVRERRQTGRILFTMDQQVMGRITIPNSQKNPVVVQVLNMSIDGIFFIIRSVRDVSLKTGDEIIFEDIQGRDRKPIRPQIKTKIVWIQDDPDSAYTGFGSKFLDVESRTLDNLENFMGLYQDN
ncbi:MAG: PilZ domain-containing protein [Calditrichaeota bacterium]|nr:PilZ domain-containing protein [Calditrichota bacterium]RQW03533.1 MAG: PilZ domain-containing protein [Calditrichota bacterium]